MLRLVEARERRQRIHVVDVLSAPRARVRIVLIAPQSPFRLARHRVDRDLPEEPLLLLDLPHEIDAFHELLERFRIALRIEVHRDEALIRETFVVVDRAAHRAQLLAQLHLLLPDDAEARHGDDHRREDEDAGAYDDELDEREAARAPPGHDHETDFTVREAASTRGAGVAPPGVEAEPAVTRTSVVPGASPRMASFARTPAGSPVEPVTRTKCRCALPATRSASKRIASAPSAFRQGPGATPVTSATAGSHSTVNSSAPRASRPESPVTFTTDTSPGATSADVAARWSTGPAAEAVMPGPAATLEVATRACGVGAGTAPEMVARACGVGAAVSFEVLGVEGAGVGVRRKGSFGPEPWMMGMLGFGAKEAGGTGRTGGRAPPAGGASKGEPVAFGDSRRVLRPENETLFSVPTQIGIRSSSVIWGDRMMCGVSVR